MGLISHLLEKLGHWEPYFLQNINDKIKTVIFIITNVHLVLLTSKDSGLVLHICPPDREGMVGISVSAYSLCQLPAHFLPWPWGLGLQPDCLLFIFLWQPQ